MKKQKNGLSTRNSIIKMQGVPGRQKIKVIHEDDVKLLLSKLGIINKVENNKVKCSICGKNITVENLPGKDQFHAKLYSLILKYVETELPNYLEQHPEIKDLQNYTKAQLSGEAQEAEGGEGAEGVDLGLAPEGGEAAMGAGTEVPPATPEAAQPATEAGVPAVEGGEVPAV